MKKFIKGDFFAFLADLSYNFQRVLKIQPKFMFLVLRLEINMAIQSHKRVHETDDGLVVGLPCADVGISSFLA